MFFYEWNSLPEMEDWMDEVREMLKTYLPDKKPQGVSDKEIKQLQELCALALPEDYVLFLKTFGKDDDRIFADTGDRVDVSFGSVLDSADFDKKVFGPLTEITAFMPDVVNYDIDLRTGIIFSDEGEHLLRKFIAPSTKDWTRSILWRNYARKRKEKGDLNMALKEDVYAVMRFLRNDLRENGFKILQFSPIDEIFAQNEHTTVMIRKAWKKYAVNIYVESDSAKDVQGTLNFIRQVITEDALGLG